MCPFHAEKTPSFHVHEQRQFFYCFGCGEKGDVFTFLTKVEQRSFMEVVRDLSQQAGVDLPEKTQSPAEQRAAAEMQSDKDRMLRAMEIATTFFEEQLAAPAGSVARDYIAKRGISEETQRKFRIGYAPAGWDALQKHLAGKGIAVTLAERLGLVGANERGHYDFFRDRVMLPVLDRQKRPIGYSSRLLDPDAKDRKYVNSPDTPLFHKKENLYGLHAAMDAIRRSGVAVVVEGNFDVLALHEAGVQEAVAPMGTALTDLQIHTVYNMVRMIGHVAQQVVIVFDGDEAGERASRKAIPLFIEADVDGRIARMPKGVDPDEFVRAAGGGADAFRRLLSTARPVVDQFVDDLSRQARDGTIPERVHLLEKAAPVLAAIRNQTVRELYVGRLPAMLGVTAEQVRRALRAASAGAPTVRPAAEPAGVSTAPPGVLQRQPAPEEMEALVLLLAKPELHRIPEAERVAELLVDPSVRQIYRTALDALKRGERGDLPAWLDSGGADIRDAVGAAVMEGTWEGREGAAQGLRDVLTRLERGRIDAEIAQITRLREQALARGDADAARTISVREFELIKTKKGLLTPA